MRALLAAGSLVLAAGPSPAQGEADTAAGQKLAELHCSRCHAVGNEGESLMEWGTPPAISSCAT